jgi:glucose-1-phosphatase
VHTRAKMKSPREALELSTLDAVVFDLGGVLLNLDYSATTRALSRLAGRDISSLYSQRDQSVVFDRFERGETSSAEFRRELRTLLGASPSDAELDSAWSALILDLPSACLDLVARLRKTHRVFLLSNTNAVHLEAFLASYERQHGATRGPWDALFDGVYYSHLVGMRKPEERIFEHLLVSEGLSRTRTLFIDDNPHNVAVARTVGMHALWLDAAHLGVTPEWRASGLVPTPLDGLPDVRELFARLSM